MLLFKNQSHLIFHFVALGLEASLLPWLLLELNIHEFNGVHSLLIFTLKSSLSLQSFISCLLQPLQLLTLLVEISLQLTQIRLATQQLSLHLLLLMLRRLLSLLARTGRSNPASHLTLKVFLERCLPHATVLLHRSHIFEWWILSLRQDHLSLLQLFLSLFFLHYLVPYLKLLLFLLGLFELLLQSWHLPPLPSDLITEAFNLLHSLARLD